MFLCDSFLVHVFVIISLTVSRRSYVFIFLGDATGLVQVPALEKLMAVSRVYNNKTFILNYSFSLFMLLLFLC